MSKVATIVYKVDVYYSPEHDSGIAWDDEDLDIDRGASLENVQPSDKEIGLKT